jgi:hypothetical protein
VIVFVVIVFVVIVFVVIVFVVIVFVVIVFVVIVPKRGAEARGGSEKLTFVRFYIVICNVM